MLEIVNDKELVFGKYDPADIIDVDHNNQIEPRERDFIYNFAVWIYRTIVVFLRDPNNDSEKSIVLKRTIPQIGCGRKHLSNTFLDILLSLTFFTKLSSNRLGSFGKYYRLF